MMMKTKEVMRTRMSFFMALRFDSIDSFRRCSYIRAAFCLRSSLRRLLRWGDYVRVSSVSWLSSELVRL